MQWPESPFLPRHHAEIWIFLIGNETGRLQFLAWFMAGAIGSVLTIPCRYERCRNLFIHWIGEKS